MKSNFFNVGFLTALYGTVLILIWIGAFKFTPTEAKAIEPLVRNSPLMAWLYQIGSSQQVSNFIGTFEIIAALLLAAYPVSKQMALAGGVLNTLIFSATLSFLFTTPQAFHWVDGFLIPDAFLLKDLAFLGVGLMVIGMSKK